MIIAQMRSPFVVGHVPPDCDRCRIFFFYGHILTSTGVFHDRLPGIAAWMNLDERFRVTIMAKFDGGAPNAVQAFVAPNQTLLLELPL